MEVQWLGPNAFAAEDLGSIPDQGIKIPQATQSSQKKKKKSKAKTAFMLYITQQNKEQLNRQ